MWHTLESAHMYRDGRKNLSGAWYPENPIVTTKKKQ